jgi:hypothetical protein
MAAGDVQRCDLEAARIRLTVYAGSAAGLLNALELQPDAVWWMHEAEADQAEATIKALARSCVRGASIHTTTAWAALPGWQTAGFVLGDGPLRFTYAPPWKLRCRSAPGADAVRVALRLRLGDGCSLREAAVEYCALLSDAAGEATLEAVTDRKCYETEAEALLADAAAAAAPRAPEPVAGAAPDAVPPSAKRPRTEE